MIDPTTGKTVELGPAKTVVWNHVSFENSVQEAPINIRNSFKFECEVKVKSATVKKLCEGTQSWKDACRLADTLNDLVEEFHAPGTPRRERRVIKREFDKVFKIFCKHCQTYKIDFKFMREND